MINLYKLSFYCCFLYVSMIGVARAQYHLIPQPQQISIDTTQKFLLKDRETVFNIKHFKTVSEYLQEEYKKLVLKNGKLLVNWSENSGLVRFVKLDSANYPDKHDYYELKVKDGVIISAVSERAARYGAETFIQLIKENLDKGYIPSVVVKDWARFSFRGVHLDVCRHFFTVDEVKKYISHLAKYKINTFHWHLTDDQGWRIEIKSHPKLTEIGAWRKIKPGQKYTSDRIVNGKYGGFYTQDQIKEVVAYAQSLNIEIIPEIEMPGHAQAALAAYPALSCTAGPFDVWTEWGVSENIFCPKEETFQLLQDVIDEVIPLFPSKYIHIGGDEAPKKRWKECAFCQDLIKKLNLKDEHELQSYFVKRMEKYINAKGRQIIGWDEILEGGLAPNATVMSWTGIEGAIKAAKHGNDAIMAPVGAMYFDYYQGNPQTEPLAFNAELRLPQVYSFNPIPQELTSEEAKHIIGLQANLWTERIQDFKHVEYMIFPRLFALSEVAWGTSKPADFDGFQQRVIKHFEYLDQANINYAKSIFEVTGKTIVDGKTYYELKASDNKYAIRYTIDGSIPTFNSKVYTDIIPVEKSMTIKAASFEGRKLVSAVLQQDFVRSKSTGKSISLEQKPDEPYLAHGITTLVDGVSGHPFSFKNGWLGFNGKDLKATLDLGSVQTIEEVSMHILDVKDSWIHAPKSVVVRVSKDGNTYQQVARLNQSEVNLLKGNLKLNFSRQMVRFLKIDMLNVGIIPSGNPGEGYPAWLFVDELTVN